MSIEVGRRIKALRRLKGMTQQQLSCKLGISVSLLSNMERGVKKPAPELLEKIVEILEVPGEELFVLPGRVNLQDIETVQSHA